MSKSHDLVIEAMLNRVAPLELAQAVRDEVELLRDTLRQAQDHLRQYQRYANEMRHIGRGFYPSHPFSPEYLDRVITATLKEKNNDSNS